MKRSGHSISRKNFIKTVATASLALPFLQFCTAKSKSFLLSLTRTSHILGHRLWAKDFPRFDQEIETKILIIGGGVSALSAARHLAKSGEENFLLVEMEPKYGGNSSCGQNEWSKYPLGAHYLPFPNKHNKELIEFLEESKLILGYDELDQPIIDEEQITFANQERLHYNNTWENHLIPFKILSQTEKEEFDRFFSLCHNFKLKKDEFGLYWFDIPIEKSSRTPEAIELERRSFVGWLSENNFNSEPLIWYLNYCCKDDYGLGIDYVSAWAGIHYFAARKDDFAVNYNANKFTWPEGNARLVEILTKYTQNKTMLNHLAFDIKIAENKVITLTYDNLNQKTKKIIAEKVIVCTPQYVNKYIFPERKSTHVNYSPWFIATIVIDKSFPGAEQFAWDNAIYKSEGLGYIYNQHQNLNLVADHFILSYYYSFNELDIKKARKKLLKMNEVELRNLVVNDLKKAHFFIEDFILEMEFHKIGHGMISPTPNYIFGEETELLKKPIENKIFFAHSDLSGISIFEEAFFQGTNAAKKVLE